MIRRTLRFAAGLLLAAGWWGSGRPVRCEGPEPLQPDRQAVCPVCGMKVSPHPEWLAQVIWDDGSALFFDGPKDMFRYLLGRERFAADKQGMEIAATFVTGYYAGRMIPGVEAFFAVGSDVLGPMGPELVPLRSADEADEFLRDHGAEDILRFGEVTPEVVSMLD